MATENTLTEVIPALLAQGLLALREQAIMPQLVNRTYENMAGPEGSTIDVPIPSSISIQTVTPNYVPPDTAAVVPTSVPIVLDQWKEAPFFMSDKDLLEVQAGTLPMQASEAIKAVANDVDNYILALCSKFYGYHGTAGTTPFGSDSGVTDATAVRTLLNKQLAPLTDRRAVLDPDAEGQALNQRPFHDMSFSGSPQGLIEGDLNRKLGFNWFMDQNVNTHTAGTGAGYLVNDAAGLLVGAKTATLDTGSGTILVGDIITFAGHTQTYVVTSALAANVVGFEPGIAVAVADDAAVTVKATHVMNPVFHRDAIAFATRPLGQSNHPASIISSTVDPISGLALRLEVSREYKRDRYSFDILYGAEVVRREFGVRLAG